MAKNEVEILVSSDPRDCRAPFQSIRMAGASSHQLTRMFKGEVQLYPSQGRYLIKLFEREESGKLTSECLLRGLKSEARSGSTSAIPLSE